MVRRQDQIRAYRSNFSEGEGRFSHSSCTLAFNNQIDAQIRHQNSEANCSVNVHHAYLRCFVLRNRCLPLSK